MTDLVEHLIYADICVVAFASNEGEFSVELPNFEFGKTLQAMGVAYVLVRDSTGYRQHYGIQDIGDRTSVVNYLLELSDKYKRLVLIGLSSGGTAAMLYGQLMVTGAKDYYSSQELEVIVISPYSNVGDPFGAYGQDWQTRGPWDVANMSLLNDIEPLFTDGPKVKIRAFMSNGTGTHLDRFHAERLGVKDITVISGATHSGLGKLMRDNGTLQRVIRGESL